MRYSLFCIFLFSSCTYNELVSICEPNEQEFLDLVQPIIEDKCMACHDESSNRPAILKTYGGVIDAINYHALRDEVVSRRMPPEGSSILSDAEISIFSKWIDCE